MRLSEDTSSDNPLFLGRGSELYTPTNTETVPAEIDLALGWLLGCEPFSFEGKLTYV